MNCKKKKKKVFRFGSADGLNRCTAWVSRCGLSGAQRLRLQSKVLDAWQTSAAFRREAKKKKKKNAFSVRFMDCKRQLHLCLFLLIENRWKLLRGKGNSTLWCLMRTTAGAPRASGTPYMCPGQSADCSHVATATNTQQTLQGALSLDSDLPWEQRGSKVERELYPTQMAGAKRIPSVSASPTNPRTSLFTYLGWRWLSLL